MKEVTDQLKLEVWNKGQIDPAYQESQVRKDACGAWMLYDEYGNRESPFGWEIDHIYPESKLKGKKVPQDLIDNIDNLRPLNWSNNDSKSEDYPVYRAKVKADGDHNVNSERDLSVNNKVQTIINELFKDYNL